MHVAVGSPEEMKPTEAPDTPLLGKYGTRPRYPTLRRLVVDERDLYLPDRTPVDKVPAAGRKYSRVFARKVHP